MKVTIKFSDDVSPSMCSAMVNGVPWTKTGDLEGYVDDVKSGRGGISWFVEQAADTKETYTMTLTNAKWAYPKPRKAAKVVNWPADGLSMGANLIYVESREG